MGAARCAVKRSYGQTSSGYQPAQPPLPQGLPPLPPGPPPPPPAVAPNPYAAYGYAQPYQPVATAAPQQAQQAAAHPQYPGYGYGGQVPQPAAPSPYQSYPSTAYAQAAQPQAQVQANGYTAYSQPQATASLPAAPSGVPPNPYGAYQNAQNYAAAQQAYAAYPAQQQQPTPSAYTPAPPAHYVPQPPQQYQQHQQPAAYPGGPAPMGGGGPSPQGAPPFKRTRYDSMGAPQGPPPMGMSQQGPMGPPPALPPLNSNGPGGYGPSNGAARGRGGGSFGGPPPIRGGPSMGRGGGYMGSPTHSNDSYGGPSYGLGSPGGPSNGPGRGGGSAGSYRGGRGGGDMGRPTGPIGFDSRGPGPRASLPPAPFPRGGPGVGPPANAPFGPSSSRPNDRLPSRSARGAFDSRGRPLSGLPSGGGRGGSAFPGGQYAGGRASTYDAPKGPRSAIRASSGRDSNPREPRKERKWGKDTQTPAARDEVKRTLTDFRISALSIPEIDWAWKAEAIQSVVQTIVEAADASDAAAPEPELAPEPESQPPAVDAPPVEVPAPAPVPEADPELTDPAPSLEPPPSSSPEKVDMSLDEINLADLAEDAPDSGAPSGDVKPDSAELAAAESSEPRKKLTKKERSKQVAAKRAATLAKTKAKAVEDAAAAAAVAAGEDGVKDESEERADSPATTTRKDAKHGRDDEEESLVITDVTAKKVKKADTGEAITLGLDMDGVETSQTAKDEDQVTPAATPLPVPTGPKALATIPTGPAADAGRGTPVPPSNRENSRLRIYFASPIASVSTYSAPLASERARSVKETTVEPLSSVAASLDGTDAQPEPETTTVEESVEKAVEDEASSAATATVKAEDDEDVDGVAFEVDGQAESAPPVTSPSADVSLVIPIDDSDDDSDEVQSALLDVKPRPGDEPTSEPSSTGAPVLPGENAAYPPIPYPVDLSNSVNSEPANDVVAPPAEPELLPPEPSADRISISYARNTRRMVLDADVVEKVTIFRAEGRIELSVAIHPATLGSDSAVALDEFRICRGILVEALDPDNDDYIVIDRASLEVAWRQQVAGQEQPEQSDLDPLLPPLHHLLTDPAPTPADLLQGEGLKVSPGFSKSHVTIVAMLDRLNPLTEARWVKTGEVEPWIASLSVATDKKETTSEWKGKITISDPDPQALETWASSSTAGTLAERNSFVTGHMSNIDNVFEILLRLTRGDRPSPAHHASATQQSSVGALAATLSAPYAEHQTQVSLAVLAMFRLSVETAAKAGIPQLEVEKQVGEIVRGIPCHLIFKSLDGMFREQKKKH
ncbi:hypothetical protein RQP46_009423 [Phenoliferia psychrophenolica]